MVLVLLCSIVVLASVWWFVSEHLIGSGRGFWIDGDLTGTDDLGDLVPRDKETIDLSMVNSSTGPAYCFIEIEADPSIYSITLPSDSPWKWVADGVYGLCEGNVLKAVASGEPAELTATLEVICDGEPFVGLSDDDMVVPTRGYAVLAEKLENVGAAEAWQEFQEKA